MGLRSVIVTSEVTFVGENYHRFLLPLAKSPTVQGLIVIRNRSPRLSLLGLLAMVSGAAPRFGKDLFINSIFPRTGEKLKAYQKEKKEVFFTEDINSPECLGYLRSLSLDLIINARSRCFFREEVLAVPKLGCLNIHHGLLPEDRGVMCDFWSHMYQRPYGFTIHQMTKKIDDGPILHVERSELPARNYPEAILLGSGVEGRILSGVLEKIEAQGKISGTPNEKTNNTRYWKNPRLMDFYRLRLKGIRV